MLVKKTNKGFSLKLAHSIRYKVFMAIADFMEKESGKIMRKPLVIEIELLRHLNYSILNELFTRKDFNIQFANEMKISLRMSEAIALMWLLRNYDHDIDLLTLKGELHRLLH